MKKLFLPFALIATFMSYNTSAQISIHTVSDFQDGTIQHWTAGGAGTNPVNIADIGSSGVGDHVLSLTSTGGIGPNSNLVIENNSAAWTGNWTAAGIRYVSFWANNIGPDAVTLRIGIDGAGGTFSSASGVSLPSGSGWVYVNIPVQSADFTADGGTDIASTLSSVTAVRILHSIFPSYNGEPVAATVAINNLQPGNEPVAVGLAYFKTTVQQNTVVLNWIAKSDIQSDYFAVMQSSDGVNWQELTRMNVSEDAGVPQKYSWKDIMPVAGTNYYKLRIADRTGAVTYSNVEIVTVRSVDANQNLVIYPNPSYDGTIYVKGAIDTELGVFTSLGVDVTNRVKFNSYSDNQYEINIQLLDRGIYYLRTRDETKAFMKY